MRREILIASGIVLLAVAALGSLEVIHHYNADGRSPYEIGEAEFAEEKAEAEAEGRMLDTFPLSSQAERIRFRDLYCLYMARTLSQLRSCEGRVARDIYNSEGDEYAWLFAEETIAYCEPGGAAGRFCDPSNLDHPRARVRRLLRGGRG